MKSVSELNKMGIGVRFNQNKLRYDLIPQEIIDELAKVFTFGAVKYDEENWKNFNEKQQKEIMASLLRHIYAHKKNEIFDKETGCTHLGHAACNIAFILHFLFKNKSREAYNLRFEEKLNGIISENQQEDTNNSTIREFIKLCIDRLAQNKFKKYANAFAIIDGKNCLIIQKCNNRIDFNFIGIHTVSLECANEYMDVSIMRFCLERLLEEMEDDDLSKYSFGKLDIERYKKLYESKFYMFPLVDYYLFARECISVKKNIK